MCVGVHAVVLLGVRRQFTGGGSPLVFFLSVFMEKELRSSSMAARASLALGFIPHVIIH